LARRGSDCFDLFFLRLFGLSITFSHAVSLGLLVRNQLARMKHSGRERGTLAIFNHHHHNVIAINALKGVLFGIETCWCDIAEHHQCLALRANSSSNSCASDQRLKI